MKASSSVFAFSFALSVSAAVTNVVDFGAKQSDCLQTKAIQSAIDAVAAAGGGEVIVPEGTFRTGGLALKSGVTLHLQSGATLEGSRDPADYPGAKRWWRALVRADGAHDVGIVGDRYSTVNGMNCYDPFGEENYRGPHCIMFQDCTNVTLRGYVVRDSANWAHAMFRCRRVRMSGVKVFGGHDAVDFHASEDVVVEKCELRTGDDCIAGFANWRCTVRDCVFDSACNVIRFGGTDCAFERCRSVWPASFGHRMSLTPEERSRSITRGSPVPRSALSGFNYYCDMRWEISREPGNLLVKDCTFDRPGAFFVMKYDGRSQWCCNRPLVSIAYENCEFLNLEKGADCHGDEARPISFSFRNCRFTAAEKMKDAPLGSFFNFREISFENCRFEGFSRPRVETRSRGAVAAKGGDAVAEDFRPNPADKVLSLDELAAALAEMPSDAAAWNAWEKSVATPPESWDEDRGLYVHAADRAFVDPVGSAVAVWRGDLRAPRMARGLRSGYGYYVGWRHNGELVDRVGGAKRSPLGAGAFAYALSLCDELPARAFLTDFVRSGAKPPAAVAGARAAVERMRGGK